MLVDLIKKDVMNDAKAQEERQFIVSQLEKILKQFQERKDGKLYIHLKFVIQGEYNIGGDKLLVWLNDNPKPAICITKQWSNTTTKFLDAVMTSEGFKISYKYNCDGVSILRTYYTE